MSDVTLLLSAAARGNPKATEELLLLVYNELRGLASHKMARERPGQTLQPTALVHEAWLRLVAAKNPQFENRAHFFAAAAEAIRRILIDRARSKLARRHGGGTQSEQLDEAEIANPAPDEQLLAVHDALDKLALEYPRQAELVKLRYFAGMTIDEAAQLMGISASTANNYWVFARTWLFREIKRG
ncbi:MAG: ECF-type sigma factor [Verrucomicrobia bacterium]|nr:ECF-type sigma factor [Verrucomicrobiota bacterium]